jgi:tRNA A37 methylthiotransferase MiaB
VFVRWDNLRIDSEEHASLPGYREPAVVRHFDAPEALDTRFYEVRAKSALNRVPERSRMPFRWTVNPYRGCSHACVYCFARPTHRYLDLDTGADFERKIVVKVNAVERLRAELRSPKWTGEHIHLPLQSGSSRILKAMRRTYTRERYLDRVALIRELVPDCSLTTDIIVGFPGETEEDFEQTLSVCEEVGYDAAFTFVYSPRRGTEAAEITEGVVPHEIKVERMQRLVEVVQRRAHERAQRFVGRTLDVLVEGPSRTDPSRLRGRSRHNKAVNFAGLAQPGEIVTVDIHAATSQTLAGEESLVSRAVA